jgi:hypothetical protein
MLLPHPKSRFGSTDSWAIKGVGRHFCRKGLKVHLSHRSPLREAPHTKGLKWLEQGAICRGLQ